MEEKQQTYLKTLSENSDFEPEDLLPLGEKPTTCGTLGKKVIFVKDNGTGLLNSNGVVIRHTLPE
jgi:hypothetical protein